MLSRKKDEQEYIAVEPAREQLGVGPGEMLMLLEAGALRCRKDRFSGAVKEVSAEDVRDAVEYLIRYRQEEQEWRRRLLGAPEGDATEGRESLLFTLSDADVMTLLLAAVSYFDTARDIYFPASDDFESFRKCLTVVERIYNTLERGSKEGRSVSQTVEKIYEQRPEQRARNAVFTYLIRKDRRQRARA